MIKRVMFILVVLCFLSFPAWSEVYGPYLITAPAAIDGDTFHADVHVWPYLIAPVSIRLRGVDTPEIEGAKCPEEKAAGISARDFTESWLSANTPIIISNVASDKYSGRYDAVVTGKGGSILATELINTGHGRPYSGGARKSWCP